jgi:hypothetical protein
MGGAESPSSSDIAIPGGFLLEGEKVPICGLHDHHLIFS